MNKTVTANISGIVFNIELDAYDKLNNYLATIKKYLGNTDSRDEVMADIESRVAELFKERFNNERSVVILSDVDHIISVMGEPEQYFDGTEEESDWTENKSTDSKKQKSKRIFRDEDDKIVGGVCSGVGHYFGIDRIWIRIIFLFAFFVWGVGFIPYLILWIVIPKAKTTAEKLEMKGEAVNVDNIKKTVEDKFNDLKDSFNGEGAKDAANSLSGALSKLFTFIGMVILFILKFAMKFFGLIFIIIGISILIALTATLFNSDIVTVVSNNEIFTIPSHDILEALIGTGFNSTLALIALILIVGIPMIGLIYSGIKMIFKLKTNNSVIGISMGVLWIVGIILASYVTIISLKELKSSQKSLSTIEWTSTSNIIYLSDLNESDNQFNDFDIPTLEEGLWIEDGKVYYDNLEVDVLPTRGDKIKIMVEKISKGSNRKDAKERAEKIDFAYHIEDSILKFSPFIHFDLENKFRVQEVKVHIMLPVGAKIALKEGSENVIYDIKNVGNEYDLDMIGETWVMLNEGLTCLDCKFIDGVNSSILNKDSVNNRFP
jgi:phage shock protein PspC (stress-responsive transcriptional regulator)